jgi:hypothetical protein
VALELHEAAFFDELFPYIREILGAWHLLAQLDPDDRQGALYPFIQFVLATIMRCVGGVQSQLDVCREKRPEVRANRRCCWE